MKTELEKALEKAEDKLEKSKAKTKKIKMAMLKLIPKFRKARGFMKNVMRTKLKRLKRALKK